MSSETKNQEKTGLQSILDGFLARLDGGIEQYENVIVALTIALCAGVIAITYVTIESGFGFEANPVTAYLIGAVGYEAVAIARGLVVGLGLAACLRYGLTRWLALFGFVIALNFVWDSTMFLASVYQLWAPVDYILSADVAGLMLLSAVSSVAGFIGVQHSYSVTLPRRDKVLSVTLSVLMVSSIMVGFVGAGLSGTAAAHEHDEDSDGFAIQVLDENGDPLDGDDKIQVQWDFAAEVDFLDTNSDGIAYIDASEYGLYDDDEIEFRAWEDEYDGGDGRYIDGPFETIDEGDGWTKYVADFSELDDDQDSAMDDPYWTEVDEFEVGGGDSVTGQVVDQSGSSVGDGTTVEIWGVDEGVGTLDVQSSLLSDLSDPAPPEFDSDLSLSSEIDDADGELPLVYDTGDVSGDGVHGAPSLQVSSGQTISFMAWDPTGSSGLTDEDVGYPGSAVDSDMTVERLSPSGEALNTVSLTPNYEAGGGLISDGMSYTTTTLPSGYYQVSVDGSDHPGIVIQVGDEMEMLDVLRDDLETATGELSEHAEQIREELEQDRIVRETVTTDENGEFAADVPSGVETVHVQAYHAGGLVDGDDVDPSELSIDALQDIADAEDYDGRFYVSMTPALTEAPSDDVEVTVVGVDTLNPDLDDFLEGIDDWDEFLDEYSDTELASIIEQELDDVESETLQGLHADLSSVIEGSEELSERVEDELGEEIGDSEELNEEELVEQIEALESALSSMQSGVSGGDSEYDVDEDGLLDWDFRFGGGFLDSLDDVTVMATYSDGTTEPVPDEYVTIDGSSVQVEDYPLEDDDASVRFHVLGDQGGDIGQGIDRIENPGYSGDVPTITSISLNHATPQVGDSVSMEIQPDDDFVFGDVEDVFVSGPDGEVDASLTDDEEIRFSAEDAGTHSAAITYSNADGDEFSENVRLNVEETAGSDEPTVRVVDGTNSRYALVSGVDSAEVDTVQEGSELDIEIQVGEDNIPSDIHIRTGSMVSSSDQSLNVSVVKGDLQESVDRQVGIVWHSQTLKDEASLWSDGSIVERSDGLVSAPILHDGSSAGEVTQKDGDGTTIRTFTNSDGDVTIDVDNSPTRVDRALFWVSSWTPDWLLSTGVPVTGSVVGAFGFVFFARRGDVL